MLAFALPLIEHFANMHANELARFHQSLSEDPDMLSVIDLFRAEGVALGVARGKAEGKAEGTVAVIRSLVASGILTIDQGRQQVVALQQAGELDAAAAQQALAALG